MRQQNFFGVLALKRQHARQQADNGFAGLMGLCMVLRNGHDPLRQGFGIKGQGQISLGQRLYRCDFVDLFCHDGHDPCPRFATGICYAACPALACLRRACKMNSV